MYLPYQTAVIELTPKKRKKISFSSGIITPSAIHKSLLTELSLHALTDRFPLTGLAFNVLISRDHSPDAPLTDVNKTMVGKQSNDNDQLLHASIMRSFHVLNTALSYWKENKYPPKWPKNISVQCKHIEDLMACIRGGKEKRDQPINHYLELLTGNFLKSITHELRESKSLPIIEGFVCVIGSSVWGLKDHHLTYREQVKNLCDIIDTEADAMLSKQPQKITYHCSNNK